MPETAAVCRAVGTAQRPGCRYRSARRRDEPGPELPDGRFDDRARRTVIPDLNWGHYGADWTGDGIPDLVAVRGNTIAIFAGAETLKKKSVIARQPTHTLTIGSPETTLSRLRQHGPFFVARGSGSEGSLVVIDPQP